MVDPVTYNVPVGLVEAYRGRSLVVRAHHPSEFVRNLPPEASADISYVQLLSVGPEVDDLVHWGRGIPVDVVMRSPTSEFMQLYRYAKLLENHPVRITVPVVAGFGSAVRMSLALNFAVKLEVLKQPGPDLINELHEVLNHYLYRPTVSRPVEFFHTLFLSFYGEEPATLWEIQEENPAHFRYVTDEGDLTDPRRPPPAAAVCEAHAECAGCEFFSRCAGYFKHPDGSYDCAGVKTLFGALREAAGELRGDVAAYAATQAEARA